MYCFLLFLPLALIAYLRLRNLQLISWLVVSLILMLLPIASVSPFRWILMLTYPLAFYSTDGLSRLKSIKWSRYKFTAKNCDNVSCFIDRHLRLRLYIYELQKSLSCILILGYFNNYVYQIPTSMLQNTISITDCQDTDNALQWFKDNVNSSSLLLTHRVFYGWALLTLNESQIRNYEFDAPDKSALLLRKGIPNYT